MHRNAAKLTLGGQPGNWLGVNFWSRTGGPLMWRNYDPSVIRAELAVLREHGLTMTRSFFYWPDFMPEPDRIDEEMTARFADFLDRHVETGMTTVPTFLVGHMSGENWDPAWRAGRDLYADVWMVAREAWFASEMVRRFAGHEAVSGWLVSNEMPIYGGPAARETIAAWAQLIISAVRAAGGTQPVSLGDGAWGIEVTGRDSGFSVADSARQCDFLGPHIYPIGNDTIRQHYAAAWACELAGTYGAPVILEEFGVSSDFIADANAAHYYRQVLHNSLLAGATGWVAWNNTDYDNLSGQDPYRHHAFEMHFGLTDSAGRPKPQLAEMADFAGILGQVGSTRCARADSDAALVVPSYLDTVYPFTQPEDRAYLAEVLRQAYVSARLADLPPALTRESDGIGHDARLYLVPSAKQLLSPTWHELEELAAGGAVVYVSYSPGAHSGHPGPWYARLNGMFGVQHQLGYGAPARIEDPAITFTLTRDFGTLPHGAQLTFRAAGTGRSRTYLPVRPDGAEVLAVDGHDRPALLLRRLGAGSLVLCTYPIEHMAAVTPDVNPDPTSTLYDTLATYAGVRRLVTVDDPRVAADVLLHPDGSQFAWLVSHAAEPVTVKPQLASGARLSALDGAPSNGTITLAPFGVGVFCIEDGDGARSRS
ncbi:MAG TPA: cellulase family glycosylhydrolase [Streptosporangiaceae bacterium]|nr:cellulase family glycosylhydrolase [Streptosporangiaceae bacterium]